MVYASFRNHEGKLLIRRGHSHTKLGGIILIRIDQDRDHIWHPAGEPIWTIKGDIKPSGSYENCK